MGAESPSRACPGRRGDGDVSHRFVFESPGGTRNQTTGTMQEMAKSNRVGIGGPARRRKAAPWAIAKRMGREPRAEDVVTHRQPTRKNSRFGTDLASPSRLPEQGNGTRSWPTGETPSLPHFHHKVSMRLVPVTIPAGSAAPNALMGADRWRPKDEYSTLSPAHLEKPRATDQRNLADMPWRAKPDLARKHKPLIFNTPGAMGPL